MRLSTAIHATTARAATAQATTSTVVDASVVAVRAKVAAPSATTVSTAPGTSKRPVAAASRLSGARRTNAIAATHNGTLMAKIHRQLAWSTSQPPSSGPTAAATPDTPAQVPIAAARSCARKALWISASAPGVSSAAPTPCSTLSPMS